MDWPARGISRVWDPKRRSKKTQSQTHFSHSDSCGPRNHTQHHLALIVDRAEDQTTAVPIRLCFAGPAGLYLWLHLPTEHLQHLQRGRGLGDAGASNRHFSGDSLRPSKTESKQKASLELPSKDIWSKPLCACPLSPRFETPPARAWTASSPLRRVWEGWGGLASSKHGTRLRGGFFF